MTKTNGVPSFTLAEIADISARRIERVQLAPELFSVLTQVRKTYQIAEDLIPSFLAKGQMTPGMAAALTPAQAKLYVAEINDIYGSHHTMDDLSPVRLDRKLYYLVIFAGHRRHLTKLHLNEGIKLGLYIPTEEYDSRYRADLFFDISALEAIELQFHENRHTTPPLHEEAEAAWRFYRYQRRSDPDLKVSEFSRSIGRASEWVRNALRFCALPESIQSYVTGDNAFGAKLPYGILVDLARLAEGYKEITEETLDERAMHFWLQEAIGSQLNAAAFAKKVRAYLADKREQVAGQFSLFNEAPSQDDRERHLRKVVAQDIVRSLWTILEYFRTVERLRSAGVLGHESYLGPYFSPEAQELFSPGSPIRLCSETLDVVSLLVPHLADLARLERTGHYRKLLRGHPLLEEVSTAFRQLAALEKRVATGPPH